MPSDVINAVDLLKSQHRTLRKLFAELRGTENMVRKARLFGELADLLTVHATIEEHHLHPAISARPAAAAVLGTRLAPLDEHRAIKRVLGELLRTSLGTDAFAEKLGTLAELVDHHIRTEEDELFPQVSRLLGTVQLHRLGRAMGLEAGQLEAAGAPRFQIVARARASI
jgi:hemerythrin superfamily protein